MVFLQFNVSVGDKTRLINIEESGGIDELFRKVSKECANDVNPEDIRLVFGDDHLEYNKKKTFKDYNLVHMSTLTLLVRLHGGGNSSATQSQDSTSLSAPTQGNTNQQQRVVQLNEIPTWEEYYDRDKEGLKKCLQSKGNTWKQEVGSEYTSDPKINSKVSLFEGDITSLQVDGIVSSNSSSLTATGGVSLRIKAVAGQELESATKILHGCDTGKVKTTEGYNLPAKYVVHTAGPRKVDPKLLESCYRNCLEEMKAKPMKSMAFPCIATGAYGYPNDKAVLVALRTVRTWLEERQRNQELDGIERIIFCLYTSRDLSLYRTWMQAFYPCSAIGLPQIISELLPLSGFIETTTTEPDMLGLDDESPVLAKMPCGHVIGPLSMTDYCRDLLKKGRYRFICPSVDPKCNREWEYFLVRHVARLTPEEMHDFEKQISENYLRKAKGMQKCPGCQIWCFRAPGTGICVRCQMCTKTSGKYFDFCWWCLNSWKTWGSTPPCGNAGCGGKDARLIVLEKCPPKTINNCNDCPSIRGCPKCGILIEHKDQCGHMDCTNCGDYGFCFICLAEKKDGKYQCYPWMETCKLAPRQTTLPGSQ